MTARKTLGFLVAVLVTMVLAVSAVVILQLYRVGFEQQSQRVAEIARSRAAFLGAVARFDSAESRDFPGGAGAATLKQLRQGHADFPGLGETGEYLFARRVDDRIVFQVPLRHAPDGSLDTLPLDGPNAEPMQRALAGETGTMVGRDYRGEVVLAAYRPVPELGLGLVAKIDRAEIREPYIRSGLVVGGVVLLLTLAGVLFIGTLGGGLVSRLEASEASVRAREKELEAALERERMASEQLRLALEAANQGVYDFDPRTGDVRVSPEFEAMLGYEPGTLDLTYDRWLAELHPDDREASARRFEEYVEGRTERYESEFRMKGADGEYRWILSLGETVARDERGQPTRFVGTHTDITHLKGVERELSAREAHLREAQTLGDMGSWELIPSRDYAWWSEGLYRIMGLDPDEVHADPELFIQMVYEEDRSQVEEAWRRMITEGRPVEVEFRVEVGGELRRLRGVGRAASEGEERPDRFLGLVQDITDERTLEEMLRQSQKMEAVGQLTAGIAHDFNNLLTTILANSDLGLHELEGGGGVREVLKKELEEIRSAAQRGGDLIRQLMTFTRDQTLRVKDTEIGTFLDKVSDLLRRMLPESVELSVESPDETLTAGVDPGALQQVMLNLATNARDAMPRGGRFALSAVRVDGGSVEPPLGPGSYVRLRAEDSGAGMEEEVRERAFEPFFTTKPVGKGTGLGLAMVYGLVERQGGTVRISSEVGVGTAVDLFFPLTDTTGKEADESPLEVGAETSTTAGGRLLVVEDEEALIRALRRLLTRVGYEVVEAQDGVEGLDILTGSEEELDLVISDVVMPRLSGAELLEECRARGIEVPFLFMSGYSASELPSSDVPEGFELLPKPWTAEELLDAVRRTLSER